MRRVQSRIATILLAAMTVAVPVLAQTLNKSNIGQQKEEAEAATAKISPKFPKALTLPVKPRHLSGNLKSGFPTKKMHMADMESDPAKIGAQIPTIRGSVIFSDQIKAGEEPVGLYEIPKNSAAKGTEIISGPDATYGGVFANGKYWCNTMLDLGDFFYVFIYGYDLETGASDFIMGANDNLARSMTYDKTTGNIYGIFYTDDLQSLQLGTIVYDVENGIAVTTPVATLPGNWNSIACDSHGQLYGISYTADLSGGSAVVTGAALNRIDKNTGEIVKVGDMGDYAPQYTSDCVIDPETDRMYWNYNPADGSSYMCEVDLSSGETTTLYRLSHNDEIVGMYIPEISADPKAPAEATGLDADFKDGSLQGTFSFVTPSVLFDGSAATGIMTVAVTMNGEEIFSSASAEPDSRIEVPVTVSEGGLYSFCVTVSNEAGTGPEASLRNIWVGQDSPVAPKVTLTHQGALMNVSWTAAGNSVNGGYLDYADVTYSVIRYPGETTVASGLRTTSFSETVEIPDDHMETYYYTVTAECNGLSSAPGQSNTVSLGTIVPPYLNEFSDVQSLDAWTIEDSNGDNETWVYDSDEEGVTISFGPAESDDWLISPPVRLEKGKAYYISFDVRGRSTTWHQLVELKYGRQPEGESMTYLLDGPVKLVDQKFVTIGNLLVPEEDGIYYIGLHDISEAEQLAVLCDNFRILEGVSVFAPGGASGLMITPDTDGALCAEVNFVSPDTDIAGDALTSIDRIEINRNGEFIRTIENPGIGTPVSFVDNVPEKGLYTYEVTGYNVHGKGITSKITNYIGGSAPESPESVTMAGTVGSGTVTVTWDAVTKDIYGNPVNPDNVRYNVYDILSEEPEALVKDYDGTSYTFTATGPGTQAFVQCAVSAVIPAGEGEASVSDMIAVGTPYTEFNETFADGETHYNFGAMSIGDGSWRMCTDVTFADGIKSHDGDNGFLACRSGGFGTGADLITGLVSLKDMDKPGVSFYTYNIVDGEDDDNNIMRVYVKSEEEKEFRLLLEGEINELCGGKPGWKRFMLPLDVYAGKTIQIKFTAIDMLFIYTMLDDISIATLPDHDLAIIDFDADGLVMSGTRFNANARVANYGALDSGSFKVNLYADDATAPSESISIGSLPSGEVIDVTFETLLSPFASGTTEYYAEIEYDADQNADNNRSVVAEVTSMQSYLPPVIDLAGTYSDNKVKLVWSEPDMDNAIPTITQDFEDGESFAAEYGAWTFVDVDDTAVGGFQDMNVPNITGGTTKGSFWIWDTLEAGTGNSTFTAHSGTKYLFSLYRIDDGQADDWAISPELQGCAQTVSFYAKSYASSPGLAERIEVYYSTGSTDPKDFIKVSEVDKVPNDWTICSADLPEGARYFAIRSCATGAFMLMVDDVTFSPAGATLDCRLTGYDVYRDGVRLNDTALEEYEFIDDSVEKERTYTYNVIAIYDIGMSRPSNSAVIGTSGVGSVTDRFTVRSDRGGISILHAGGIHADISDITGLVIFSDICADHTYVETSSGVYVVRVGDKVVKVHVK